ncbi:tetratricopeptide repeat protein [Leptolyngbya sp. KIOST-1]|uniref:tetratricopeptide repeat protein n=1 Tax=Leptolyngbya sp. KIOST-1 TaxID=1229172 RepID=UPI00068E1E1B|nr:tetratricopeptide repeat protein [Leptolyngbya sp. KIOST-1]
MTSSNKPWLTSQPDSALPEFLGLNLESFRGLATFCDLSEGFAIAFAEVNFAADGDRLIQALRERPECQAVQLVVLDFSQERLASLLPRLMAEVANLPTAANLKLVVVLRGLETSIGIAEDDVVFLEDLNFIRDALARRIPHPIIFVLPKYALKRLARTARDFWAWASAVFEFRSVRSDVNTAQTAALNSGRLFTSDLKPVKQSRIDQLHRLLEEYAPAACDSAIANAEIRLTILLELADAYRSLSEMKTACQFYRQALSLAQASQKQILEAEALLGLGKTLRFIETDRQALETYEQALTIYREVGARLGEANTLQAQGDVLQFLKQSREALETYEQALTIYREVGDRLGEANTLQAQGDVLQFLDQRSEALGNYEQALTIYREVGDRLGEANTLKAQGEVLQFLDQRSEALGNYEQALTIYREVGDRLGEANTLKAQGDVLQFLKQSREALGNYEQALTIYREVGDRLGEANTLKAQGDVLQFLKQSREALGNYEQALTIYREVGARLGEANTLQAQGDVLQFLDQRSEALANYEQALTIYREVGDRLGEANTLQAQGDVLQFLKQSREALANYEQALTIYREVGARLGEANAVLGVGSLQDDPQRAMDYFLQAQAIFGAIGSRYSQGRNLLMFIVQAQVQLNDLAGAHQSLDEATAIGQEIGFEPFCQYADQVRAQLSNPAS